MDAKVDAMVDDYIALMPPTTLAAFCNPDDPDELETLHAIVRDWARSMVRKWVAAEREACAQLADEAAERDDERQEYEAATSLRELAARIRRRRKVDESADLHQKQVDESAVLHIQEQRDMVLLLVRLIRRLKRVAPDDEAAAQAEEYLRRHKLLHPLRDAG